MPRAPLLLAAALLGILLVVPSALALETSLRAIRATGADHGPSVATAYPSLDGTGVVVAILDTGVDNDHPAFRGAHLTGVDVSQPCNAGGYLTGADPHDVSCYGESNPVDTYGHGTHVAGILLGRGTPEVHRGVAPDARLVDVKIAVDLTPSAPGLTRGLAWVKAYNERHPPGEAARIDIVSVSAGSLGPGNVTDADALLAQELVRSGVVVVAAAGNCGNDEGVGCSRTGYNTTSSPAIAAGVLGVGATDDMGTPSRADDLVAGYSSRGPAGGSPKPDLVAPGTNVRSAFESPLLPPGSDAAIEQSGTSMATPHVSGVVALMLEADPTLRPAQVVAMLHESAWRMGPSAPSPDWGHGLLDAYEAVRLVKQRINAAPEAALNLTTPAPVAGESLALDASMSRDPDGAIVSWSWDFGDGTTATGASVRHAYAQPGTYTVVLTIADDFGATATATLALVVASPLGEVTLDAQPGLEGATTTLFTFTAAATGPGDHAYHWDLGDGTNQTGRAIEHRYAAAGDHKLRLTVRHATGIEAVVERVVRVRAAPVSADIALASADAPVPGDGVALDARGSSLPGGLVEAVWDFGDGIMLRCRADGCDRAASPEALLVTHTYAEPGAYRVRLTLRDASGATATAEREVRVLPALPPLGIVAPVQARVDEVAQFEAEFPADAVLVRAYRWTFGDGASATGRVVSHLYAEEGDRNVSLAVEDEHGRVVRASLVLHVAPALRVENDAAGGTDASDAPDDAGFPLLLAIMEPLNASEVEAGEVLVRWEYDDARAPVTTIVLLDGDVVATTEHAHVRLFVPPGEHVIGISSTDAAGRSVDATTSFRARAPWEVEAEQVNLTPLKGGVSERDTVPGVGALGLVALAAAVALARRRV